MAKLSEIIQMGQTDGPFGRLKTVNLQTIGTADHNCVTPNLQVQNLNGTRLNIYFTPSASGRDREWEPWTWYKFEGLLQLPELEGGVPLCPTCETALTPDEPEIRDAVELATGVSAAPELIGTAVTHASKVGSEGWLSPISESTVDTIQWECESCGCKHTETAQAVSPANESETLASRIASGVSPTSSEQSKPTVATARQTGTRPAEKMHTDGDIPATQNIGYQTILSNHDFRGTVPDTTQLSSISPTVEQAVTTHPITGEVERFIAVNLQTRTFDWARYRPAMNLVVAVDISGSMGVPFHPRADSKRAEAEETAPSKFTDVSDVLVDLIQRLDGRDTLGIILFDADATVVKPVRPVTDSTTARIRDNLADVVPENNTDVLAGYRRAGELLQQSNLDVGPETENRILIVSDSLPSTELTAAKLYRQSELLAADGIKSSFLGLSESRPTTARYCCQATGSNTAVATSTTALRTLFRRYTDSILFPVADDLTVTVDNTDNVVDIVPRSDSAMPESTFQRRTIFPPGPTRQSGSHILYTCDPEPIPVEITLEWQERDSTRRTVTKRILGIETDKTIFDSSELRTKVALYRYYQTLQEWCPEVYPTDPVMESNRTESKNACGPIQEKFSELRDYLCKEQAEIGDAELQAEINHVKEIVRQVGQQ